MGLPRISNRDKKMIVGNFMEELCKKYQNAALNRLQTKFYLKDFYYMDVFEKYLPEVGITESNADNLIRDTLQQYEKRGYYKIEGDSVTLTEKGLDKCRDVKHDWD